MARVPSSRLNQFAKELRLIFPNAQKMNRSNHTTPEIVAACRAQGVTDLIVVHETRGEPGFYFFIQFFQLGFSFLSFFSEKFYLFQLFSKEGFIELFPF